MIRFPSQFAGVCRLLLLSGLVCSGALDSSALEAQATTRVELIIDELQAARSVPWPITTGVPFPKGQLKHVENCRLVDDAGQERPLQARVAATWDAERTSIRWLTIDFVADPGRKYALEFGPEVRLKQIASRLRIEAGEPLRVSTGAMTAEFSAMQPSALGRVCVDLDGDGEIRPAEEVAAGGEGGEHYCIDQAGRRSSSGSDGQDRRIEVEASGPVRACIRVDGFYTGPDGRRTVAYRTRYHFFAGLGLMKVVDEFRVIASTRGVRWTDVGFALRLPGGWAGRSVSVATDDEPGSQVLSLEPAKNARSISSFQATYRHYGNSKCAAAIVEEGPDGEKVHQRSDKAGGWMQVADSRASVTGSLRWFWQQFPKEWEATPDGLTLHLWSPRGGELDFGTEGVKQFLGDAGEKYLLKQPGPETPMSPIERFANYAGRGALERGDADGLGIRKHHEFHFHFASDRARAQSQEYGRLAAQPPIALASGAWNCGTDVFGPLAARPGGNPDEAIVDRIFDLSRFAQDTFGDYGWWLFGAGPHYGYKLDPETGRHYAVPYRFEHHTYQKETQLWWCYLRSGERKFLDWALPSENHWVDVAVSHEPTTFRSEWHGGEPAPAVLNWPRGDWAIDNAIHYLRHHDSAEAWLRGQSQYWASYHRTLETTTLAYYLTGDERFNDVIGYWRDYWSDLAGKTSSSPDFKPWHREQAWYRLPAAGERPKTWAEMLRDYAPFNSGSRHQLTLLFNLSTLYEHTWDPQAGLALREYAAAFLDPAHPIGVWRCQDNRAPSRAEAPTMAHYWTPALWKYGRATGDPRMPDLLRRYFDACLGADPFREDLGIYSNVQIGYAYYFTRDPRHLRPALEEVELLRPLAVPLAKPEDLGERINHPAAPVQALTGVPRLLWALGEAGRNGVAVPPPTTMRPQRAPLALSKAANTPIEATLWGYERELKPIGPNGKPFEGAHVRTRSYESALQPFDRTVPGFQVFLHELTIPRDAPPGWYFVSPKLEIAVLALRGSDGVKCNAAAPVAVHAGEAWLWKSVAGQSELRLASASPKSIRVVGPAGQTIPASITATGLAVPLGPGSAGAVLRLENTAAETAWLRIDGLPAEQCWVATAEAALRFEVSAAQMAAVARQSAAPDPEDIYVAGRFGKGILIVPGRTLHLPDHEPVEGQTPGGLANGKTVRLFNTEQGTIEFWVKRLWDERLVPMPRVTLITNGLIESGVAGKLPLNEWAHVAIVWHPLKNAPQQTIAHVYIDGLDRANYRNIFWAGYGDVPFALPRGGKWLEEFVSMAPPGTAFALDELRISTVARYANLDLAFGPQQSLNPFHFTPAAAAFPTDPETSLLFHFDDNLQDTAGRSRSKIEGRLSLPGNQPKK